MDMQLKDKRALVTGSSAGIGFSVARHLLLEGAVVMLCGRRQDRLDTAADALRTETGGRVETTTVDVTCLDEIISLATTCRQRFDGLDILINNAGTGIYKPFLEVTDEELMQAMQMNFLAMFRVTQRLLPLMLDSG